LETDSPTVFDCTHQKRITEVGKAYKPPTRDAENSTIVLCSAPNAETTGDLSTPIQS
jgi:hypothetical protein